MRTHWKWRILSLLLLLFFSFLTLSRFTTSAAHPRIQFPCQPPYHNSYPFCDTSLSIPARVNSLLSLLDLPEKILQLSNNVSAIPRLGLPAYEWWSESLHGLADNGPGVTFNGSIRSATSFPQVILTTASFNRSLWYSIASAIAVEARAMFNVGQAGLTFWSPNVNIFRDPRWGRGQETPGEDPMVAAAYSVEFVNGFQGEDWKAFGGGDEDEFGMKRVLVGESGGLMLSACCKHFTAYDLEDYGSYTRYNFNAVVTQQDLEDTYQPPFRSCIQQGRASCLMCSYNAVNGIPACARKDLLQKAREEWGFKGYITSDCDAVATIHEYHHYSKSKTPEDAVALALKAGMDINCGTYLLRHTQSAIDRGKLQEEDIDRALGNLFSVLIRLGLFDGDPLKKQFGKLGPQDVCTSEHQALALEAARQGIVLLKNEKKFLPLNKDKISSLAIIGPMANGLKLGGDYSGLPCSPKSLLDAFKGYAKKTSYAAGCLDGVPCSSNAGFSDAVGVAKEADFVIVVAGLDLSQEDEDHDRFSLLLPGYQSALVTTIAAVSKKPLILVLTGGGPLDVSFAEGDTQVASILWIGYPGEAGGKALAEVIFGDYNPGGRLPMTWYPESFTSIPMTDMNMRADPARGYPGRTYRFYTGDRIYGFGHGLSYTTFTYTHLSAPNKLSLSGHIKPESIKISQQGGPEINYILIDEVQHCDSLIFHVWITISNDGDMDGSHVLMLFSRVPKVFKGAPEKQLVGFDRVHIYSKGSVETSIMVDPCKHLGFADEQGKRILPLGNHTLMLLDWEHIVSIEA